MGYLDVLNLQAQLLKNIETLSNLKPIDVPRGLSHADRLNLVRRMSTPDLVDYERELGKQIELPELLGFKPESHEDYLHIVESSKDTVRWLGRAEPYFVSREINAFIDTARTGLTHSTTLHPEMLPAPYGFVYLCPRTPYADETDRFADSIPRAFLWAVEGDTVWFDTFGESLDDGRIVMLPAYRGKMRFGVSAGDNWDRPVCWGYFAAFLLFINQRILKYRPQRAGSKKARRKYQQQTNQEPFINVVHLRGTEYRGTSATERRPTEFKHRWLVSGHWRNQWYPSEGRHRPIWVRPYLKGPEDKPIKMPKRKVFAVVR